MLHSTRSTCLQASGDGIERGTEIAQHADVDRPETADLGGIEMELDHLGPADHPREVATTEEQSERRADQHHHVGRFHTDRTEAGQRAE